MSLSVKQDAYNIEQQLENPRSVMRLVCGDERFNMTNSIESGENS